MTRALVTLCFTLLAACVSHSRAQPQLAAATCGPGPSPQDPYATDEDGQPVIAQSGPLAKRSQQWCSPGQSCSFECPEGGCAFVCAEGSTCSIECDGGRCQMSCGTGATCNLECDGGQCGSGCSPGSTCNLECDGGSCAHACAPNATCNSDCEGGNCASAS